MIQRVQRDMFFHLAVECSHGILRGKMESSAEAKYIEAASIQAMGQKCFVKLKSLYIGESYCFMV